MRILGRAALLCLVLAAALPALVLGHATLERSTPDIDATLTSLPPEIILTFDDDLTSDSSYAVLDAGGATVATGGLDGTDPKSLSGPMPALADGTYEIRWTAISSDDKFVERGSFKFTVALAAVTPPPTSPPAPSSAPSATVLPSASPTSSAGPSPTASVAVSPAPSALGGSTTGDSSVDVLIPIAVVGILVGVGLGWFLRRRGAA